MSFPSSPTNNQIATINGITYTYSTTTGSWSRTSSNYSATAVTVSSMTVTGTSTANTFATSYGGQFTGYHTGVVGANTANTGTFTTLTVNNSLNLSSALKENVYTVSDGASVDLDPANGTIQVWTLGSSRTPTANNFTAGQSVTLMIGNASAKTVTWTSISVTWVGGVAPTLASSGYNIIELWKVSTTVYGTFIGSA
jgi:hypothetical protein